MSTVLTPPSWIIITASGAADGVVTSIADDPTDASVPTTLSTGRTPGIIGPGADAAGVGPTRHP